MPIVGGYPLGSTFGNPKVDGLPATFAEVGRTSGQAQVDSFRGHAAGLKEADWLLIVLPIYPVTYLNQGSLPD